MKTNDSLTWLYNLFNTSTFDTQQTIDYLYFYPQTGIHHYLTKITDFDEKYTLHLVHIMFYHSEDDISYPIMDILIKKCLYNKSFSLKLFFILKSYRKYLTKQHIKFYRLIIQRIMECDKFRRDRGRQTIIIDHQPIENLVKSDKEISSLKFKELEEKISKIVVQEDQKGRNLDQKERDVDHEEENNEEKSKKFEDLMTSHCTESQENDVQFHDLNEKSLEQNESKLSVKNIKNKSNLRTKRYMLRLKPILNLNRGTGDLSSLFLFFCSASSFFFPNDFLEDLISYEKMFHTFKAHSIVFPRRLDTTFKGCVNFIDDLVMISFRLKNLPIKIRQRALEIELEYMNQILPAKIRLPFSDDMDLLHINTDYSRTLNSAENVPFILVYECSKKIKHKKKDFFNDIYLLRQLYALEKTGSENQSIKDKIIEQLVLDDGNPSDDQNATHSFKSEENLPKETKLNWTETANLVKNQSYYPELNPQVKCIIIKTGNDLGPELIAYELLNEMKKIFDDENLRIWIKPYRIYSVYHNAGFVEVVTNAPSIHEIKKVHSTITAGKTFLRKYYCEKYQERIDKAIQNFLESLVGYSLVSYFLGLKDRHNGNILIDDEGHVVHVDFGFILGLHPGIFCVETAPFKMSAEYLHLLGSRIDEFEKLFIQGFLAIRKNYKKLLQIMEICADNPKYKFLDANAIDAFKKRLKNDLGSRELEDFIMGLIDWSIRSTTTGLYDSYQYFSNGYMK